MRYHELLEVKVTDGYWTAVSPSDLQTLVQTHGDLRGVANEQEIFLGRAGHEVHHGLRNNLGLPPLYGHDGNSEPHGFDFYVAPISAHYEHEDGADDPYEGRDDWGITSPPAFTVGQVAIWVSESTKTCLSNRQFARMVGQPLSESRSWVGTFDRDSGEGHYDMFKNPSRSEAFALMRESEYKDLRGILTPTDIYVWRADCDIHFGAFHHLGMEYDVDGVRILLDAQGPFINQCDELSYFWPEGPKTDEDELADIAPIYRRMMEYVTDHPGLKRIYGPNYRMGCR